MKLCIYTITRISCLVPSLSKLQWYYLAIIMILRDPFFLTTCYFRTNSAQHSLTCNSWEVKFEYFIQTMGNSLLYLIPY